MIPSVHIHGLGCAVPPNHLTGEEFASLATRLCARIPREEALIRATVRRSGVDERRIALPKGEAPPFPFFTRTGAADRGPGTAARMAAFEELAPALAAEAAREALAASGLATSDISHLVTASCTGFAAPGVDLRLMADLSLSPDTARVNVGFMGCHGAVNACRVARALAAEDPAARVLAVAVELCTLHFQYGLGRDELLPNTLFGDGAAALVIGGGPTTGLRLLGTASRVIPDSADAMTWRITDTGFRMTLESRVPDLIAAHTGAFVRDGLAAHGLDTADVGGWAIHPGGPRVVDSVLRALALPPEAGEPSREVLRSHGNMSSATVLFVLRELLSRGAKGPIVALAFGPGLTAEMAVFAAH